MTCERKEMRNSSTTITDASNLLGSAQYNNAV